MSEALTVTILLLCMWETKHALNRAREVMAMRVEVTAEVVGQRSTSIDDLLYAAVLLTGCTFGFPLSRCYAA